uniref:Uncharacterized protein n=1 Tax=Rhizophora mucronata TaxID=61149 RepID=A0A2P2QTE5_RHIMU
MQFIFQRIFYGLANSNYRCVLEGCQV